MRSAILRSDRVVFGRLTVPPHDEGHAVGRDRRGMHRNSLHTSSGGKSGRCKVGVRLEVYHRRRWHHGPSWRTPASPRHPSPPPRARSSTFSPLADQVMPGDCAVTPRDLIGKLDLVLVECPGCDRRGWYGIDSIAVAIGMDARLTDWLRRLAKECAHRQASDAAGTCEARFADPLTLGPGNPDSSHPS